MGKPAKQASEIEEMESSLSDMIVTPLDAIPQDVELPCSVSLKLSNRLIPFRMAGQTLTVERVEELRKTRFELAYIPKASWIEFVRFLESHVVSLLEGAKIEAGVLALRHLLFCHIKDTEEKGELYRATLEKLSHLVEELVDRLNKMPVTAQSLIRRFQDTSLYFANHSVNVAVYCYLIGAQKKFSVDGLRKLTLGGLLHNIGILTISPDILYKPGTFNDEEKKAVRVHPLTGGEILQKFAQSGEVREMALQHHERIDGSGYPQGLHGQEVGRFARICAVADVLDALKSHRPHQAPFGASEIKSLLDSQRGKLDAKLIDLVLEWEKK